MQKLIYSRGSSIIKQSSIRKRSWSSLFLKFSIWSHKNSKSK